MLITMWITIGRVWEKGFGGKYMGEKRFGEKYVGDIIAIPIQVLPPGRFTFDLHNSVYIINLI